MAEEDNNDDKEEEAAEDGVVIEGYNPPKPPLSQNQNPGPGNNKDNEPVRDDLEEDDNKNKTPGPNTTTTRSNPVLDSKDNNVSKVFSNVLEQIKTNPTISSTKKQRNITITETLDTPASSNNSSPANSPRPEGNESISNNNEPKTPPPPETYIINNNTQPTENKIIGRTEEETKVSPNPERLNNSDINEIILQENTPTTTPGPKTPPTTPPTTPSPNSVAQIIGGPEGTIVTTETTTEPPPTTPRPKTPDQSNNLNDLNNNTTQAPQQETITPSAKNADIDDLIGKYYQSAGEKTAEYIKKNTSGFSSYNPNTNERTYKDTSKTYGHLNKDDTTPLSNALKNRQVTIDRTKDDYKKTDERQSKNDALDHEGKIKQRQKAVTDAGKGFHEGVFEKHENYQKLEVQEQETINIAGVKLKTNGKQIDFPPDLGEQHSNLSFIASFSFVDEKGNNMKKKDAVYFGVSYKNGKITDLMMPGGIKKETAEGNNKGNAYIEIGEGDNKKKYYAKASFETIQKLEKETTKNREEAIKKAKLQEAEEAKIKAKYEEQFNKLSSDDQDVHNRFGSLINREKLRQDVKKEMNESATNIQRVFRGHKVRKDLAEKEKQPQQPTTPNDQRTIKPNDTTLNKKKSVRFNIPDDNQTSTDQQQTQTTPPPPPSSPSPNQLKEAAAIKIQSLGRGYNVRKNLENQPQQHNKQDQNISTPPGQQPQTTPNQDPNLTGGNNQTSNEKPPAVKIKQNTGTIIEEQTTITTTPPPPRTKPEQTTQTPPNTPPETQPNTPPNTPTGQQPSNTTPQGHVVGGNNTNTTEPKKDDKKQSRFWGLVDKVKDNNKANSTAPNGPGVDNTEPAAQPTNPGGSKVIKVASKTQEQDKTNETEKNNKQQNKSYFNKTLSSVISSNYSKPNKDKDPITLDGLLNSDEIDTATKIALHSTFNTTNDNKLLKGAKEGNIKKMQKALNNGANVNALSSKNTNTALHRAVEGGNTEMVKLLLAQEKIDVNIQNKQGNTALHHAVEKNNFDMVELLLEKGARTDIQNNAKKTVHNILDEKFETLRKKDRKQSNQNPDYQPLGKISNLLTPYDNSEHSIGTTNRSRSNSSEKWGFELNENNPNSYNNNCFASMNNGKLNTNNGSNSKQSLNGYNDFDVEPDENSSLASTPRSDSGLEDDVTNLNSSTINALQTKQNPRSGVGNGQGRKGLAWGDDNSSVGSGNLSRNNSSDSLSNDKNKEQNKVNKEMKESSKSKNSLYDFNPDSIVNKLKKYSPTQSTNNPYPPNTPTTKTQGKNRDSKGKGF